MRKLIFITIVCAFLTVPAMAGVSVVSRVTGYYESSFGGGEFTLSTATLDTGAYSIKTKDIGLPQNYYDSSGASTPTAMTTSFQTFCVELNEAISPTHMIEQTIVNWDGTNSYAVFGGKAGQTGPSGDPLDSMTAYLYKQFATGVLSNYDYPTSGSPPGANRDSDAKQLQKAIWYIEEEIGLTWSGTQWVQTVGADVALGESSKAHTWYLEAQQNQVSGDIGVRILNLYDSSVPIARQDVLFYVPVPGAVLLGILGLSVAGIKLRKYA